jgi:PEP-CTERM motif
MKPLLSSSTNNIAVSSSSTPAHSPRGGGFRYQAILAVAIVLMGAISSYASNNLVTNGNFESGTTGFTSNYTQGGNPLDADHWEVVQSANWTHFAWVDAPDHTIGDWVDKTGHYFVANGSPTPGQAVWQSSTPLNINQQSTTYRFEAYVTSVYDVSTDEGGLHGDNGPYLTFQVGDGTNWYDMGTSGTFLGTNAGDWKLIYFDAQFGQTGSYYVRLMNAQYVGGGNDLGVDDIYYGLLNDAPTSGTIPPGGFVTINGQGVVPEPSTYALLCISLGVVGFARKKMTKTAVEA